MSRLLIWGGVASVAEPTIKSLTESATVLKGDSVTLTVVAESPDGGTLSYQWWSADAAETEGTKIEGETSASYKIKKVEKTLVYYVVVTNTKDGVSNSKTSDKITITMTEKPADVTVMKPVIIEDLAETQEVISGDSCTLRISAKSSDGGTLSYQWYSAESAVAEGTAIEGATDASYTIEKVEKTLVYYVIVTNTKSGKSKSTASKKSTVKMTEKQDGMITVTLDVESIAYNTFSEGSKEVKFLDGSTKNKTISVQSGTTLADIIKEHDSIPLEVSEYKDKETLLDITVNTHGTFYDKQFNTAGEFYDFLSEEENKNAIETLVYTPLTSDCTFYAYPDVMGTDIEIYEREEHVDKSQWSQNSIPFYVGESKTAWVRMAADNWLCCYEAADGSGPATVTADSFVELKPAVCMKDEKKAFKVEAPAPGLYVFELPPEAMYTGILPSGNIKIKLEPTQFDDDLYFVGGATSWDFSHLEPFNADDEFTFVAASAAGEFKVSTYEWGMRFTNNSEELSPGKSVPLTLCGVADEGKDENAKFSGLVLGAKYTVQLKRDSSGMPVEISLVQEPWDKTKKLYFMSAVTNWNLTEDALFKDDNTYTFIANAEVVEFKICINDWNSEFLGNADFKDGLVPLSAAEGAGSPNGAISGLVPGATYTVILIRTVEGYPDYLFIKKIKDAPELSISDVKIVGMLDDSNSVTKEFPLESVSGTTLTGYHDFKWTQMSYSFKLLAGNVSYGAPFGTSLSTIKKDASLEYTVLSAGGGEVGISGLPFKIPDGGYTYRIWVSFDEQNHISVAVQEMDSIPNEAFSEVNSQFYKDRLAYICSNFGNYPLIWSQEPETDGNYFGTATIPVGSKKVWGDSNTGIEFGITNNTSWSIKWIGGNADTENTFVSCEQGNNKNNCIQNETPVDTDIVITVKSTEDGIEFKYTVGN